MLIKIKILHREKKGETKRIGNCTNKIVIQNSLHSPTRQENKILIAHSCIEVLF